MGLNEILPPDLGGCEFSTQGCRPVRPGQRLGLDCLPAGSIIRLSLFSERRRRRGPNSRKERKTSRELRCKRWDADGKYSLHLWPNLHRDPAIAESPRNSSGSLSK